MALLGFTTRPGESIFDQLVFAAQKAFLSGEFSPGQKFPSVRTLATELKIHPNTAQKAVHYLIQEGWLEVKPGIGTVFTQRRAVRTGDRKRLLHQDVERLIVEAKSIGVTLHDLVQAISSRWNRIDDAATARQR
jgi:GntR family transcriptional regulator